MFITKTQRISAFLGMLALSQSAGISAAPIGEEARFTPIQSISYEIGSKRVSGYFLQESGICDVTLMIIDQSDAQEVPSTSPTRVRLLLQPQQIAGLDSEEDRALNFTCGEGAATLLVDLGETAKLVALQRVGTEKVAKLLP
jgi:hypothetical protein